MILRALKFVMALQMVFLNYANAETKTSSRKPAEAESSQELISGLQEYFIKTMAEIDEDVQFLDANKNPTTAERLIQNGVDNFSVKTGDLTIAYKTSFGDFNQITVSMGAFKNDRLIGNRKINIDVNKPASENLSHIHQTLRSFGSSLSLKNPTNAGQNEARKATRQLQRVIYFALMGGMICGFLALSQRFLQVIWRADAPLSTPVRIVITGSFLGLLGFLAYKIEGAARPKAKQ